MCQLYLSQHTKPPVSPASHVIRALFRRGSSKWLTLDPSVWDLEDHNVCSVSRTFSGTQELLFLSGWAHCLSLSGIVPFCCSCLCLHTSRAVSRFQLLLVWVLSYLAAGLSWLLKVLRNQAFESVLLSRGAADHFLLDAPMREGPGIPSC